RTRSALPARTCAAPTSSAYTNPAQAALRSNPGQVRPSVSATGTAPAGIQRSGEHVARISRSTERGSIPALFRHARPAAAASEEVVSPGPANRRSRIPVRSTIHWSFVPMSSDSKYAFGTTRSGRAEPRETTLAYRSAVNGPTQGRDEPVTARDP